MRYVSYCLATLGMCALTSTARADLPSTAPTFGGDPPKTSIWVPLEQSVSVPRQNDPRDEAEQRLLENEHTVSIAIGSLSTSIGATLLIGGIAHASSANWGELECAACLPSVGLLIAGGLQFTILGLIGLLDSARPGGRRWRHRVDTLLHAMSQPSIEAASAARRTRLTVAWSLLVTSVALAGSSVALIAVGHQDGFDDGAREAIAAANAYVGGWLATIGSWQLVAKWPSEMAIAPTRNGAMITYERRW